jgi:hypothetical protein
MMNKISTSAADTAPAEQAGYNEKQNYFNRLASIFTAQFNSIMLLLQVTL